MYVGPNVYTSSRSVIKMGLSLALFDLECIKEESSNCKWY